MSADFLCNTRQSIYSLPWEQIIQNAFIALYTDKTQHCLLQFTLRCPDFDFSHSRIQRIWNYIKCGWLYPTLRIWVGLRNLLYVVQTSTCWNIIAIKQNKKNSKSSRATTDPDLLTDAFHGTRGEQPPTPPPHPYTTTASVTHATLIATHPASHHK